MRKKFFLGAAALIALTAVIVSLTAFASRTEKETTLVTYPAPEGPEMSTAFTVNVRPEGGSDEEWKELPVFGVKVMSASSENAAFVYFDCDGPVEVQVVCNDVEGLDSSTAVYPKGYGTELRYVEGTKTVSLTAEPNQSLVLDPNGDTRHNLQIFANELIPIPTVDELEKQGKTVACVDGSKGDSLRNRYTEDVVYVKPGFYPASVDVRSDQTWYFEGGAVVNGAISLNNTTNAKLIGHGMVYRPFHLAINVINTKNAYIDGMMAMNYGWGNNGGYLFVIANAKNIVARHVKSIARNRWGDGIDIFCSEDVAIEDCFIRSNDDCIAIYGPRWTGEYWGETGNVRNIHIKRCVLMPDNARPIHFGTHGDSSSANGGRVIDNCRFKDIDILVYNKYAVNSSGASLPGPIHLHSCEGNMITNIYFDNIRIQDGIANNYLSMQVATQGRYGTDTVPGRGIDNVYFKNVSYYNDNATFGGGISGYDKSDGETSVVKNVTFENLKINGKVALSAEDAHIGIGNNAKNIRFVRAGEARYVYEPSIVPEDIWPEYHDYARLNGASVDAEESDRGSSPSAVLDDRDDTVWYSPVNADGPVYDGATGALYGNGLTVDLGTKRHINAVRITWENEDLEHGYRIYVSEDGVNWGAGRSDEQATGAVNPKAQADYNRRVETTWFSNQETPIRGRYVKIIPDRGYQLDIAKLEVLGEDAP